VHKTLHVSWICNFLYHFINVIGFLIEFSKVTLFSDITFRLK